jgi:p-aminobenzoyl-glutamate transporter AbgT
VDQLAGHHYPNQLYIVWNCVIQFAGSAILGLLVQQLKATLKEAQSEKEKLARALEELERSTEKIKKLQSQIQVVCAWTNRVKVVDEWMPMGQFLESELGMKVSHGMSSEAVDKFKREIEESMEDKGVPDPPHADIAPEKEK